MWEILVIAFALYLYVRRSDITWYMRTTYLLNHEVFYRNEAKDPAKCKDRLEAAWNRYSNRRIDETDRKQDDIPIDRNKTYCVVGIGSVGEEIVCELLRKKVDKIITVDKISLPRSFDSEDRWHIVHKKVDLSDLSSDAAETIFGEADVIFYTAACMNISEEIAETDENEQRYRKSSCRAINYKAVKTILSACSQDMIFVYLSTGQISLDASNLPREESPLVVSDERTFNVRRPLSFYHRSKIDCERYLMERAKMEKKQRTAILRPCYIYGPRDHHGIQRLIEHGNRWNVVPLNFFLDYDFVYASDVVRACLCACFTHQQNTGPNLTNCFVRGDGVNAITFYGTFERFWSSYNHVSFNYFIVPKWLHFLILWAIGFIEVVFRRKISVEFLDWPTFNICNAPLLLDPAECGNSIGYGPKYGLEAGVEETIIRYLWEREGRP